MRRVLVVLLSVSFWCSGSARWFRLGRHYTGNLRPPNTRTSDLPPAQWFTQKLDHFSPTDLRTWRQRYFVNDTFYDRERPGPVFLMIGGEGEADARWTVAGAWIEYARRFRALCLQLEHRYYGQSHPTPDASVKSLQFLSSRQALADLAHFIVATNERYELPDDTKWVAFGGSYPGALAAWLRLRYPHLVHAAVSSSGPLRAVLDFDRYFEVVVDALTSKSGGDGCVRTVQAANAQLARMIVEQPMRVEAEFRLCKKLSAASGEDMSNLYSALADNFAGVVQYNEDNRIGESAVARNVTIRTVCDILTEPGAGAEHERLATLNSLLLDLNNETCLDYDYDAMIDGLRRDSWDDDDTKAGARQWTYQTCTEFGYYQTSSRETRVFGDRFAVDFYARQCRDIFGAKFGRRFVEEAIRDTNTEYGALELSVSRVVFVHGSVDPWHALGVTSTRDEHAPAVYVRGTAHCADMYPSLDADPDALKEARLEIVQYLDTWVDTIAVS